MPEPFDISASADAVVALLNANRTADAMRLLEQQRQDQPQAIQESLDRMVSSRGQDAIGRLQQDVIRSTDPMADPDAALIHAGMARLGNAGGPPRFPTETEVEALTPTQRYDVYASIIETRGNDDARESLRNGERVILGLRQDNTTFDSGTADDMSRVADDNPETEVDESRRGTGVYDDRVVVLGRRSPEEGADPEVWQFNRSTTEPTAQYSERADNGDPRYASAASGDVYGNDVDGDGIRDAGRMREGTFEMLKAEHPNPGSNDFALRPTPEAVEAGAGMVERDVNGDGLFNADDGAHRLDALDQTFKIHAGSRADTDSAGCQTIVNGDEYNAFTEAVRGNPDQTRWQYVLTETTPGEDRTQGVENPGPEAAASEVSIRPQPRPDDLVPPSDGVAPDAVPRPQPRPDDLAPPSLESLAPETSLRPQPRPEQGAGAALELPRDPLRQQIEQSLERSGALQGMDPEQRDNVLAASYNALSQLPRVDHVGVYNGNLVGTYAPSGLGTEPMHNVPVDIARAQDMPAAQSLAAAERSQQERALIEEPRGISARAA